MTAALAIRDRTLLAKYMVGKYRLGYRRVALYLAGVLYESIINTKVMKPLKSLGYDEKGVLEADLNWKINKLNSTTIKSDVLYNKKSRDLFKHYFEQGLLLNMSLNNDIRSNQVTGRHHNFRWLRNKVMHGNFDEVLEDKARSLDDIIYYVWCELANESFETALTDWRNSGSAGRMIDTLYEHTADYMVRAIDEVEFMRKESGGKIELSATKISVDDFGNLFDLRRKLVFLKKYLDGWLTKNADFLKTDILTTIDTTSGYIWMPLVSKQVNKEERAGIYDCSVSLLATPLDLRIYMDFGGNARQQRDTYYNFLEESSEYLDIQKSLAESSCLEVFDIDWYSAIFNCKPYEQWLKNDCSKAIQSARSKLAAIAENDTSPITWNRCLHGYVFSKYDLGGGFIDFSMIKEQLENIIRLYQAFDAYVTKTRGENHE